MDRKFHPAIAAIKAGDIEKLKSLVREDPSLATDRSTTSHPTLLQCLALDALNVPNKVDMAKVLIDAGAELNEPLVACGSMGNAEVAETLLEAGAKIDGTQDWSPLEEALYWRNNNVIELLLERGASVKNLRIAAGLGRIDALRGFVNQDGTLKPEAGKIEWPFGQPQKSNLNCGIKGELQAKVDQWSNHPQDIINNAFIYACAGNHIEAAKFLLEKGADVNAIAPGFDYSGTALHNAALHGHRTMVDFLLDHGADPRIKDTKVGATASGWADHGGYPELRDHLAKKCMDFTGT